MHKDFECDECGEEFSEEQWDDRHTGDDNENYHEDCCPECNPEE